jgi:predicted site-specific integrase-resolvase
MLNKKQLAELYGISRPTLNKWLKEAGLYVKGKSLFTPAQVEMIYQLWGKPK